MDLGMHRDATPDATMTADFTLDENMGDFPTGDMMDLAKVVKGGVTLNDTGRRAGDFPTNGGVTQACMVVKGDVKLNETSRTGDNPLTTEMMVTGDLQPDMPMLKGDITPLDDFKLGEARVKDGTARDETRARVCELTSGEMKMTDDPKMYVTPVSGGFPTDDTMMTGNLMLKFTKVKVDITTDETSGTAGGLLPGPLVGTGDLVLHGRKVAVDFMRDQPMMKDDVTMDETSRIEGDFLTGDTMTGDLMLDRPTMMKDDVTTDETWGTVANFMEGETKTAGDFRPNMKAAKGDFPHTVVTRTTGDPMPNQTQTRGDYTPDETNTTADDPPLRTRRRRRATSCRTRGW